MSTHDTSAQDHELLEATEAFDLARVKAALEAGADVNARGSGEDTALITASMRSMIPIMEVLLGAGAAVDLKNNLGATALIAAASGRGGDSIELLLANQADPNLGDLREKKPLMWMVDAQFHRGLDTSPSVRLLAEGGADVNGRDEASRAALHWAVKGNGEPFDIRPTVLTALVENGADVGATDVNGETAMFGLVRHIDDVLALDFGPKCIKVLVDAGADRNHENNKGQTPLAVVDPRNDLVLDRLRDLGFTSSEPSGGGGTR